MKRMGLLLLFIIITIIISACGKTPKTEQAELTIYTSIYPIQYIVDRIGDDAVQTESVYPPGVNAHTYEPTTRVMTAIADSDAFIYMGAGMEGFAESAAKALHKQDVKLIEIGKHKTLFQKSDADSEHHHGQYNPHIWLDPLRMIDMASIIKDELNTLNPKKADVYTANFKKLKSDLIHLDQQYTKTLETKKNKTILVSHAAYGYWEERYGIKQISIHGISSSNEPSQKELTAIMDQVKAEQLHYILFEQNGADKLSQIIKKNIHAKILYLHNLSTLTDDNLKNHEDYLDIMKQNLKVLDKATS